MDSSYLSNEDYGLTQQLFKCVFSFSGMMIMASVVLFIFSLEVMMQPLIIPLPEITFDISERGAGYSHG